MIRRSWHRLAIANAGIAVASLALMLMIDDDGSRLALIANAIGTGGIAAWALRKDDDDAAE